MISMPHILQVTGQKAARNSRLARTSLTRFVACVLLAGGAGLLPAQTAPVTRIGGSLSGYLYWPADQTLRPILGYPGAAVAGEPVLSDVEFASVSPDGRWAVVVRNGQTKTLHDFREQGGTYPLLQSPDRVVWSKDRRSAVLYSSTAGAMQKVRLSDGEQLLEPEIDLSEFGTVTALALSPDGGRIAMGTAGAVYLLTAGQQPLRLARMENPVCAVFSAGGTALYVLNQAAQPSLLRFSGETLAGQESFPIAAEDGATADLVSVALSETEQYLLLADRAQRRLQIYDKSSMQLSGSLSLDYSPAALEPLTTGAAFLVKPERSAGTHVSIVLAKEYPSIYFLPPPGRGQ